MDARDVVALYERDLITVEEARHLAGVETPMIVGANESVVWSCPSGKCLCRAAQPGDAGVSFMPGGDGSVTITMDSRSWTDVKKFVHISKDRFRAILQDIDSGNPVVL